RLPVLPPAMVFVLADLAPPFWHHSAQDLLDDVCLARDFLLISSRKAPDDIRAGVRNELCRMDELVELRYGPFCVHAAPSATGSRVRPVSRSCIMPVFTARALTRRSRKASIST